MLLKNYGKVETYQVSPATNGYGNFYFTDCGNRMYSVRNDMAYHGKLCPKCGRTLYIRGSDEANKYWDKLLKEGVR